MPLGATIRAVSKNWVLASAESLLVESDPTRESGVGPVRVKGAKLVCSGKGLGACHKTLRDSRRLFLSQVADVAELADALDSKFGFYGFHCSPLPAIRMQS